MNAVQLSWDITNPAQTSKTYYTQVWEETTAYGIESAGIKELLALIVGPRADSKLCHELACLTPDRFVSMRSKELIELGMSPSAAFRIEAIFQLMKMLQSPKHGTTINCPTDAAEALSFIKNEEQEHFVVLLLDTKNHIKKTVVITKGINNSALAHPREVFKTAIRESANSIIIGHNHPSGDPTPSREDIEVTKRLSEVGDVIGIPLLDSMIVGVNGFCSLKERGIV